MRALFALVAVAGTVADAEAGPLRRRSQPQPTYQSYSAQSVQQSTPYGTYSAQSVQATASFGGGSPDALDEVNAARARRGLRPFLPDPALTQAALSCAQARAARGIRGHLQNDFAALPPGAYANAAGCGALEPSWGWGTCCTYDTQYVYAGAAWIMGTDGRRYMHLFVR